MLVYLLAALQKQQYNLRILHWKATGLDFETTHAAILDGYIDQFGDYIDKVAEMMLMCGEEIPTSREIDELASKDERIGMSLKVIDYESEEIYMILDKIFMDIISIIKSCSSGNKYPSYICSELDSIEYWFSLEGKYKNKKRLK